MNEDALLGYIKRVGIITIHNSPNYGACLQSYALYKYISMQGCHCELIDLHRPHEEVYVPSKKYKSYSENRVSVKQKIKRAIKRILKPKKKATSHFSYSALKKFDDFNAQIKLSKPYYGIDALYDNPPEYDLYITGSDQVWNPSQRYCLEPYFLTFVSDDKPKISYAASIGITKLRDNEKRDFKTWLARYDAISVREKQAKELLESFTGLDVKVVADPVFLLDVDLWKQLAVYPQVNEPYILLFTLQYNKALLDFALRLKQESGLQLIYLEQKQPPVSDGSYVPITDAGPKEFLGYVTKAEIVITVSFHCTAFSIIMGASNFYAYIPPENERGSRITDLLDTYGLGDHLLSDLDVPYSELKSRTIQRDKVEDTLRKEQKSSRGFLNEYLVP